MVGSCKAVVAGQRRPALGAVQLEQFASNWSNNSAALSGFALWLQLHFGAWGGATRRWLQNELNGLCLDKCTVSLFHAQKWDQEVAGKS